MFVETLLLGNSISSRKVIAKGFNKSFGIIVYLLIDYIIK